MTTYIVVRFSPPLLEASFSPSLTDSLWLQNVQVPVWISRSCDVCGQQRFSRNVDQRGLIGISWNWTKPDNQCRNNSKMGRNAMSSCIAEPNWGVSVHGSCTQNAVTRESITFMFVHIRLMLKFPLVAACFCQSPWMPLSKSRHTVLVNSYVRTYAHAHFTCILYLKLCTCVHIYYMAAGLLPYDEIPRAAIIGMIGRNILRRGNMVYE